MSIVEEIKESYRQGGVLTKLIYINIAVFVSIRLLQLILGLSTGELNQDSFAFLNWLALPSSPMELILKPWTLFTYMFLHYDFLHVLFNLLYLYWFGKLFLEFLNPRQLLGVYIYGGLAGGLLYVLAYNYVPLFYQNVPSSILMGASASVMAILMAVARYAPNHQVYLMFFGAVRLKYIALIAFTIDIISIPTMNNTGGHLAHIGGAAFGLFYGGLLLKGADLTKGFSRVYNGVSTMFTRKATMKVTHKRPLTDMEYNAQKKNQQRQVDDILDKIKSNGYESLSKHEKEILFDASKK